MLGLYSGYTIQYTPLPSGVPLGFALGNSFRQGVYLTVYLSSRPNMDTIYCALHTTFMWVHGAQNTTGAQPRVLSGYLKISLFKACSIVLMQ